MVESADKFENGYYGVRGWWFNVYDAVLCPPSALDISTFTHIEAGLEKFVHKNFRNLDLKELYKNPSRNQISCSGEILLVLTEQSDMIM